MSLWCSVRGLIVADTFAEYTPAALYRAQCVVDHLPRITGSEGPAQFYVTVKRGTNQTICGWDELHQYSNLGGGRRGNQFEAQSQVLISVCGDLRDRWLPQTLPEVTKTLARLASRLSIDTCLVSVEDDCGQKFLFNNPKWLRDMPMSDWMLRHGIAQDWSEEDDTT